MVGLVVVEVQLLKTHQEQDALAAATQADPVAESVAD
jgi:hypothetical protein